MVTFNYLTLSSFVDKNLLDDDARWWIELFEIPEMNPIREYKYTIIEEPYQNTVSLDLDTRVRVLLDLIEDAKHNKNCNKAYLKKLTNYLVEKCSKCNRIDLVELLKKL